MVVHSGHIMATVNGKPGRNYGEKGAPCNQGSKSLFFCQFHTFLRKLSFLLKGQ
jgi:hypothetical protein